MNPNTHQLLLICLLSVGFGLPITLAMAAPALLSHWRYDRRNPYRRYCKSCGVQQDQYQHALGAVTWETVGQVPQCKHHHPLTERS